MENRNFYNGILTGHNLRPAHKHDLPDASLVLEGMNPSCGDDIWLKLETEEGVIRNGASIEDGCVVSQAFTDMTLDLVIRKKEEEAVELAENLFSMIRGTAKKEELQALEEASVLRDISHMPARVKYVVLGWRTLNEMLEENTK